MIAGLGALAVLLLLAAAVLGACPAYRAGFRDGRTDAIHRLVGAKDSECHVGAHFLVSDLAAEAETQRIERKKP